MVKVQTKLLTLLTVATILFLLGMLAIRQMQYNGIASLVAERTKENEVLLDKLIKLKGNALSTLAVDYTYWDEMVTFVQTGDLDWAKKNIDSSLAIFNTNAVWVYKPDYSLAYASGGPEADTDTSALPAPLPQEVLTDLFAHERLIHVFVQTAQGLMEIRGATIHPTTDKERHTPPAGYFLAGRLWDQAELDELAELIGGKIMLHTPPQELAMQETGLVGMITLYRSLAGWDGRPIAQIQVDLPSPITRLAEQALHLDFWLFTLFIVLLSIVIFSLIMVWVVMPLRHITRGLDAEDVASIQKLKNEKTEFGHIAQLIESSFQQKAALQAEITGREQAEVSLRNERDFSEVVLNSLPGLFFMLDEHGRIVRWSHRAHDIESYTDEEVAAMNFCDFFDKECREQVTRRFRQVFVDGEAEMAATYLDKNGRKVPYYLTGWRKNIGEKTYLIGFGVDLTERKKLESQLLQAQKMDAIGRLAGGVAHDFNNLLTVITGYTELLMMRTDGRPCPHQDLEQIQRAAQRAASLTRQLLAFSRQQVLQTTKVDLNEIVHDIQKMLVRLIGEDIELATALDPHLGQVSADPAQMEQVIMNLAVNARDAMPTGGHLSIETKNVFLDESYANHHLDAPAGSYVMLAFSDTGHGMDQETMKHVFEPFFTTKELGEGTGLGLATVHGIVTQSGGRIMVYSEPGHGTTFKVYLPLVQREKVDGEHSVPHAVTGGAETILIVEDEEELRTLAKRILEDHGYTVFAAQNGPEAIAMFQQAVTPIDLLLTDMIMPGGLNGGEVAMKLQGISSELKVIYMSGYTNHVLVDRTLLGKMAAFLQKPFTPEVLLRELRNVLGRERSGASFETEHQSLQG
jgi:PAS domain S-box-containing protein